MHERTRQEIAAIGGDRLSGATALLLRGLQIVQAAAAEGPAPARAAALELCRAQPSMAGFRTAAAVALDAQDPAAAAALLAERVRRAPSSIARHAAGLLSLRRAAGPLRIVTYSRSSAVEAAILATSARETVTVACGEGRPGMEGRQLALALAERGIAVELYGDWALGAALSGADAVLVGADAVAASAAVNKVGTAALAAQALQLGVPTYVLAGLEKVVPTAVFDVLPEHAGPREEVWPEGPPRVAVRNPYFERVPHHLITAVLTEAGAVAPDELSHAPLWPAKVDARLLI